MVESSFIFSLYSISILMYNVHARSFVNLNLNNKIIPPHLHAKTMYNYLENSSNIVSFHMRVKNNVNIATQKMEIFWRWYEMRIQLVFFVEQCSNSTLCVGILFSIWAIERGDTGGIYFNLKWKIEEKVIGIQWHTIRIFKGFCSNCFLVLNLNENISKEFCFREILQHSFWYK